MWSGLWVIGAARTSLERYEEDTLSRLSIIDLPDDARVIDIASDGRDQLFVLVRRGDVTQVLRIDCAGRIVETVMFEGRSGRHSVRLSANRSAIRRDDRRRASAALLVRGFGRRCAEERRDRLQCIRVSARPLSGATVEIAYSLAALMARSSAGGPSSWFSMEMASRSTRLRSTYVMRE